MIEIKSNDFLFSEVRTIEAPIAFVELFAANPKNLSKWLVGIKNGKNKFEDIKVKNLMTSSLNVSLDQEGLLLDVVVGKDEHKLLIKKPSMEKGLTFILSDNINFELEGKFLLRDVGEEKTALRVDTRLLKSKHKFHPITSFEIKHFFKKSLENFVKACEKSYATIEKADKDLEAQILYFYQENIKDLQTIIEPLKNDLGEETYEDVQKKLKNLGYSNSQKLQEILNGLFSLIPKEEITIINTKIMETLKNDISILKSLPKDHSTLLSEVNTASKLGLNNIDYIISNILKYLDSNKVVKLQEMLTDLLQKNATEIEGILDEIKNKIPDADLKNLELSIIALLKKDLTGSKTIMDKIVTGNPNFSAQEEKFISNLNNLISKYEADVNTRKDQYYTSLIAASETTLNKFVEELSQISSKVTYESLENTKNNISEITEKTYNTLDNFLDQTTPESLAENQGEFNKKIDDILDRYSKAIKIIDPQLDDQKIQEVKDKISKTVKEKYSSFAKK